MRPDFDHRLVVKFNDDLLVRALDAGVASLAGARLDVVDAVVQAHGATFSQLIKMPQPELDRIQQQARQRSGVEQADLAGMLEVHAPEPRLQAVADVLWASPQTEWVEFEMIAPTPPCTDIGATTPNFIEHQTYRGPNPGLNLDAAISFDFLGSLRGLGIIMADCEYDLHNGHEDLCNVAFPANLTPNTLAIENWSPDAIHHGTASMGVNAAIGNAYGMTGLAHYANNLFCSEWSVQNGIDRATAISEAIAAAGPGDVILLEMQTSIFGAGEFGPAELDASIWTLVNNATQAQIIVVAAAGNGDQNLDSINYSTYMSWGDSGAIIVGAGTSAIGHDKLWFSTFGSRVNVQGWGENVATLGYGTLAQVGGSNDVNQFYANGFGGTSSASAMVAGVATALQSFAVANTGSRLTPLQMRDLLINTGIPQGSGGHIGPFPDMLAAVQSLQPPHDCPPEYSKEICDYVCSVEPSCCTAGGYSWNGYCGLLAQSYWVQDNCASCPIGATPEPESCGTDTNGGCNSNPPAFTTIACGETICGTVWAGGGLSGHDSDWYQIIHPGGFLEWTVLANFEAEVAIFEADCSNLVNHNTATGECRTVASAVLPAGDYYLRILPINLSLACGTPGSTYVAYASCGGAPNDHCTNAEQIWAGLTDFSNQNATTDGPAEQCGFLGDVTANSDADVWYKFVAPCSDLATFTFTPQFDQIVAIYDQVCPTILPLSPLACEVINAGAVHNITLPITANESYFIRIGGVNGQQGDGTMTIAACPCDDFDAYDPFINVPAQSAWEPWNGDPTAENFFVTNVQSLSPPHSLGIDDIDDAVRRYFGYTSGRWTYQAWTYVPLGTTDTQYFILLNTYPPTAPRDWSMQIELDGSTDTVADFNSTASLPMVKGQWVPIRVEINLNNDEQSVFYDNQLLVTKSWTAGVSSGGALNIAAVNLWGNGSSDEFYYDDLCLEVGQIPCPADLNGDGVVDVADLLIMLGSWLPQWGPPCTGCPADLNGDGFVDTRDLLLLLAAWGPCP